jgi:hypothetical protein
MLYLSNFQEQPLQDCNFDIIIGTTTTTPKGCPMKCAVGLICLFTTLSCQAQNIRAERSLLVGEARELRRETRSLFANQRLFQLQAEVAPAPEERTTVDLTAGIAHTALDNQNAWNVPAQILIGRTNQDWKLAISTLGYETDRANHLNGWTDVKIKGLYAIHVDDDKLWLGVAARAPSHGEVGSKTWQQEISAAYKAARGKWHYAAGVALKHNSKWTKDGVSANPIYGSATVEFDPDDVHAISFTADRLYTRGGAAISTATFAYDFPLYGNANAEVALSKGVTPTDRSATVEFDFLYSF